MRTRDYDPFGEAHADRYLDELDEGLQQCGAEPEDGRQRNAVRAGYGSKLVRRHLVFYTFTDGEVRIQRVLHGSMDPPRHV
jgi:plasmid stabilization system protein ParE